MTKFINGDLRFDTERLLCADFYKVGHYTEHNGVEKTWNISVNDTNYFYYNKKERDNDLKLAKKNIQMTSTERTKLAADAFSDFVNNFNSDKVELFELIELMGRDHRTLQQSFTRLCLQWIEHVAEDSYRTDGRNEQSKAIAKKLLTAFSEKIAKEDNWTGETLKLMSKPSGYLSHI